MDNVKYKKYVYIGRFQLPHNGHEHLIEYGIKNADRFTILIGSSNAEKSEKNPFSFSERKFMIEQICEKIKNKIGKRDVDIEIIPLKDFSEDQLWQQEVLRLTDLRENEEIHLLGCKKSGDESTYYLDLFPNWNMCLVPEKVKSDGVVFSSTELRNKFFNGEDISEYISPTTLNFLNTYFKKA